MKVLVGLLFTAILAIPAFAQDEKAAAAQDAVQRRNFDEALGIIGEPETPLQRYWAGRALVELKRYEEADAQFMQVVEADRNDPNGYEGLGRVAVGMKDYVAALENAHHALELNGKHAGAYYVRGLAYAYRQDYANSAPSLERSLELDPENGYGYYQLGMIQYRQKRFDQTIRNFQKFVEMMPNAPEAAQVRSILRTIR